MGAPVALVSEPLSVCPKLVSKLPASPNYSQLDLTPWLLKVVSTLPLVIWKKTIGDIITMILSKVQIGWVIKVPLNTCAKLLLELSLNWKTMVCLSPELKIKKFINELLEVNL